MLDTSVVLYMGVFRYTIFSLFLTYLKNGEVQESHGSQPDLKATQKRHQEAQAREIHLHQGHGPQVPPQPAQSHQDEDRLRQEVRNVTKFEYMIWRMVFTKVVALENMPREVVLS